MKKIDLYYDGEFGPELQLVIPYAYYLHCRGLLGKTVAAKDTKALYYFSEAHEELYERRTYRHPAESQRSFFPNPDEHTFFLKTSQWIPPSYKAKYENNRFKWGKEPLIISNKYGVEWGGKIFNYLDLPLLKIIFDLLSRRYQLIYSRFNPGEIIWDGNTILDLKDQDLLKEYPGILTIQELRRCNPDLSCNTLQLMLYANCRKFISVQGGNSVFASYFGGTNLIYALKGMELVRGDFNHFPLYSGASICPCLDRQSLLKSIQMLYLPDDTDYFGGLKIKALPLFLFMKYNSRVILHLLDPRSVLYLFKKIIKKVLRRLTQG